MSIKYAQYANNDYKYLNRTAILSHDNKKLNRARSINQIMEHNNHYYNSSKVALQCI